MNNNSFDDKVSNLSTKDYTLIYDCLINEVEKIIKDDTLCQVKDGDNFCKLFFSGMPEVVKRTFESISNTMVTKSFEDVFKIDLDKAQNVSINFEDEKRQEKQLENLQSVIENYLGEKISDAQAEKIITNLCNYINEKTSASKGATFYMRNNAKSVDLVEFTYTNNNISQKEEYLKKDLLDVKFKGKLHKENIKKAILNHYEDELNKYETLLEQTDDLEYEDKINDLEDIVNMINKNDFIVNDIHKFTYEQRNACLTRVSNFLYLETLINSIDPKKLNAKDKDIYLKLNRYAKRFHEFEDACTDILLNNKDVSFYVLDKKKSISILNYLRNQRIYTVLPIVGKLSSILGYERGVTISEKYGTSLKLNGEAKNTSEITELTGMSPDRTLTSFQYTIWKLKSLIQMKTKSEHMIEKLDEKRRSTLIKTISHAMLCKFMMLGIEDINYDAKSVLIEDISKLRDVETFTEARKLLYEISKPLINKESEIEKLINEFARVLETKLIKVRRNEIESIKKIHTYRRHLVLFKNILPNDALSSDAKKKMKEQMNTKNLKYTSLVDDIGLEKLKSHILMSYTYDFTIESTFASFERDKCTKITSTYINEGELLNIHLTPSIYTLDKEIRQKGKPTKFILNKGNLTQSDKNNLHKSMKDSIDESQVIFPYMIEEYVHGNSILALVMNTIYKTMLYVCIRAIISRIEKNKEITHINIHTKFLSGADSKFANSNKFVHDCYKEIDFVLGRKYITNSQGINSQKLDYKNYNYACSVYSNIKRKYESVEYKEDRKIAILSITGKVVDSSKNKKPDNLDNYKSNKKDSISIILGELYIAEQSNGNMYFEKKKNIIDSTTEDVYEQPSLILDTVNEIKDLGITDIIYLSSAPYQMKYEEEDEDVMRLFYFNESIIKMMSKDGLMNIYPVYYNENSISDSRGKEKQYPILINRDTSNLHEYCKGYSVGISPFLQMYTGYTLDGEKTVYNSMITYSTIRNMYDDLSLNKTIYDGIFNNEQDNKTITNALIALHIFKYEKNQISAKIDPFEKLTGKNAIAQKASKEYRHNTRSNSFKFNCNSLAEIRYLDKTLDLIKEKQQKQ